MMDLSVVIITHNEERNIERCLKSLRDIADEIIVVDSFSNDLTQKICEKYHVHFVQRTWEGYTATKNYANALAKGKYILSLDADEALSETLYKEILAEKQKGFQQIYAVNRLTNYLGKWIYHSGWFPDVKVRIFPREHSFWKGEFVHEELHTPRLPIKQFKGILEHYSYYSYEDHQARADKYSKLTAQKHFQQGKRANFLKPWSSAIGRFIAMYILKLGFLDGWKGFKIAVISAKSNKFKYNELRRLQSENN